MARYVLARGLFYRGAQMRVAKIIDDAAYDISDLRAAGALLIPLPNDLVEARAAEVREQQAKGLRGGELTELYSAYAESEAIDNIAWQDLTSLFSDGPVLLPTAVRKVTGQPFPTLVEWWTADPDLVPTAKRRISKAVTRDAEQKPTQVAWTVYGADGVTVLGQVVDVISYDPGTPFETKRTRTVT
jgi:hypothetical protein